MSLILPYFLKLSISLGIVWLFYQLILRRLTFYNWNRMYLLAYTLLSFFIPLIDISKLLEKNEWTTTEVVRWVPVIGKYSELQTSDVDAASSWTMQDIWFIVLMSGMLAMLFRLIIQLFSFRRMMRRARFISEGQMNVYQVDENIIPFSFGNSIFINQQLHSPHELQEIIRHEFVHVKQRHSIDIIWAELLCLLNWYNPFAWLIRRSIRQNLEFIADYKVLENGIDKKQYQYLLLKVIGSNQFSIAQKFNFSSLKKRIAMMNKLRTTRIHLIRFLFVLPLLAVILVSFRKQIGDSLKQKHRVMTQAIIDSVPSVTEPNGKGYFIDIIGVDGKCTVVVKNRDHKEVARMLLSDWEKREEYYTNLYGHILPPPPPVPPLPPGNCGEAGEPAVPQEPPAPSAPPALPTLISSESSEVSAAQEVYRTTCSDFELTDTKAIMHLKDGKTEVYDLTNKDQRQKFETKYGKLYTTAELQAVTAPYAVVSGSMQPVLISPSSNVNVSNPVVINSLVAAPAPGVNGHPVMVSDHSATITGKEDVLITITAKTTARELDAFIDQMKLKGVVLKFSNKDFNDGKLVSLTGTIERKGSRASFSATDFKTLILAMVEEGDNTYFKVNITEREVI
jgi:hypothetical protein